MAFLDKINEIAKTVAKDIAEATKNLGEVTNETIETTKINAKIAPEKKSMDAELRKIGEYYYRKHRHGEGLDEAVLEFCTQADIHYAQIEELKERAAEIEAARIRREEERAQARLETEPHFAEEEGPEEAPEAEEGTEAGEEVETIACPDCGALNEARMNFCSRCGARLDPSEEEKPAEEEEEPAVKLCPNCGREVAEDMNFCGECGAKLS